MLAIIPARGGSKGLAKKNIKCLNGKPLIAYTIDAAARSKYISDIFVSTDSREIADVSKEYGAWVPELRPPFLAKDDTASLDVFIHTVDLLERNYGKQVESFAVLQPTSPLRTSTHIDESIELFIERNAESVVSYTEEDHPVFWNRYVDANNRLSAVFPGDHQTNRQAHKKTFYPNGAIYVFNTQFIRSGQYYSERSYAYLMDKKCSVDIDTIDDFLYAEFLLNTK